jgi:hypothetical protein
MAKAGCAYFLNSWLKPGAIKYLCFEFLSTSPKGDLRFQKKMLSVGCTYVRVPKIKENKVLNVISEAVFNGK